MHTVHTHTKHRRNENETFHLLNVIEVDVRFTEYLPSPPPSQLSPAYILSLSAFNYSQILFFGSVDEFRCLNSIFAIQKTMRDVFCLSRKCSHSAWMDIPFFSFARHNAWHGQLGGSLLVKRTPNTYRRRPPVNVHVNLSMLNYNTHEMNDKDAKINYFFFTIAHRIRRTSFDKIRSQNLLRCALIENDNFLVPERFCTGIAMTHFMQLLENVEFEDLVLLSSSATFLCIHLKNGKISRNRWIMSCFFRVLKCSFHFISMHPFHFGRSNGQCSLQICARKQ